MKKEELMKIEGMTEELAAAVAEASAAELRGMVPTSRLNEVIAERDAARKDHAEVLKELGALQKSGESAEALQQQIKTLQENAKTAEAAHAAEIKALKIDNAVEAALMGAKARNLKAVKALLDLEGAELQDDGSVKGLEAQIKALQAAEDSKFMFGSSLTMKGAKSGETGNEDGDHGVDTSKMTYSELAAYMAEHPDVKI